jgi:hypothetical protein
LAVSAGRAIENAFSRSLQILAFPCMPPWAGRGTEGREGREGVEGQVRFGIGNLGFGIGNLGFGVAWTSGRPGLGGCGGGQPAIGADQTRARVGKPAPSARSNAKVQRRQGAKSRARFSGLGFRI